VIGVIVVPLGLVDRIATNADDRFGSAAMQVLNHKFD
jgi:hypothetical protein